MQAFRTISNPFAHARIISNSARSTLTQPQTRSLAFHDNINNHHQNNFDTSQQNSFPWKIALAPFNNDDSFTETESKMTTIKKVMRNSSLEVKKEVFSHLTESAQNMQLLPRTREYVLQTIELLKEEGVFNDLNPIDSWLTGDVINSLNLNDLTHNRSY